MISATDLARVIAVRRMYAAGKGRQARHSLDVSGVELAQAVGISPSTLCHYESASRVPATEPALALARVFESLAPHRIPDLLAVVTDAGSTG